MQPAQLVIPVPDRVGPVPARQTKGADALTGLSNCPADALTGPVVCGEAVLHGVAPIAEPVSRNKTDAPVFRAAGLDGAASHLAACGAAR